MLLREIFGPRGRNYEEDVAEGNICTQERGSERRRVLRGIIWPQER